MANPWENDPIDASATPTKAPEYEPWMSDAVDTAQTTTTQAQPEHHQKFLQNLAPLIKGAAKAAIGPSFIQAGKNIRKQFQESIKPDTIEGSPEEKTFRELGRAAGNVYGIPIEVAKGIYGTVKEGVQSLTPKPVQQAVVPAAQEVESGLGQAVQSAGNIPLPGGHKVSDIPQGAEYMYNQLSPRAKENLGAAANLAMLAPAGKGVEMLAGATEKAAPKIGKAIEGVVTPIREKAQSMAAKATENKIDTAIKTGIDKGIKPTVVGKKTLARHNKFYSDANNAVRSIADNRDKIKIIDENGEAAPHPRSAAEMAQAVDQTKQILYKQYHDMAMAAGDKGAQFEAAPVIEKIDKVGKDLKENPETRAYAESLKKEVEEIGRAHV